MQFGRTKVTTQFEALESRTLFAGTPLTISQATYLGGTQLRITGTTAADSIGLKQTSTGVVITNTGGWTQTVLGFFKSIRIDAGAGDDSIKLDPSVTSEAILYGSAGNDAVVGGSGKDRIYGGDGKDKLAGMAGDDVLVSIGGSESDLLAGGAGKDSFWTDANEAISDVTADETAIGSVHRVGTFSSYTIKTGSTTTSTTVSKEPKGEKLVDPLLTSTSIKYKNFSTSPLFADAGPKADDIVQGAVGDCYFLATLASIAKVKADVIRQSVVDLGDGTFAVQFFKNGARQFIRVDGDLPTYSDGALAYAGMGSQNSIWVAIMEKAYTFFRSSQGTYKSIEAGWMSEVYSALNKTSTNNYSSNSASWLASTIKSELAAKKSVTFAVLSSQGNLIGGHAYTVDSVITNSSGTVTGIKMRNPWGIDGAGSDGKDDGYVIVTPSLAQSGFLGLSTAAV